MRYKQASTFISLLAFLSEEELLSHALPHSYRFLNNPEATVQGSYVGMTQNRVKVTLRDAAKAHTHMYTILLVTAICC